MRLGFDLDEVVVDLATEFEEYLGVQYGIEWPRECFTSFRFEECYFDSDEDLNTRITDDLCKVANDPDFQSQAEPVPMAREVLQKFKRSGHKLFYITSRPRQNQPATFKWMRQNDIPFDDLAVIGKEQKGIYGLRYKLDMYVDDLEKHLHSMWLYKKKWRKGLLLLDRPWNDGYYDGSRFTKVQDWQAILRHVGIQNR